MLATLETQFGSRPEGNSYWVRWVPAPGEIGDPALILLPKAQMAEFYIHGHWQHADQRRVPAQIAGSIPVFVNDSRWMIQCPTCNGAQLASVNDKRFFCTTCLNSENGGRWLRVVWPKDAGQIEETLKRRPNPSNRHWLPHETVADLERENREHGVAA